MRTYVPDRRTPSKPQVHPHRHWPVPVGPGAWHCTQQAATLISPNRTAKACLFQPRSAPRDTLKTFSIGLAESSRMAAGDRRDSILGPNPLGPVELQSCRRPCAWLADADLGHAVSGGHGLCEPHRLIDKSRRCRPLRCDHLATDEDLALAVTGGDAEIGLPCLSPGPLTTRPCGDPKRHL